MAQMPRWMIEAQKYLGTKEIKGKAHNAAILGFFKDAGFSGIKDDETAWCAAFVGAILKRCNIPPSKSLLARSYETWGVKLSEPIYGCIGVKKRLAKGKDTGLGHVGFVVAADATTVTLLGGNQADGVSIASFPREDFTGFRWVAGEPTTTVILPKRSVQAVQQPTEA